MKATFGQFSPTNFYVEHPFKVLSLRHWSVNNSHTFKPSKNGNGSLSKKSRAFLGGSWSVTDKDSVSVSSMSGPSQYASEIPMR